MSSSERVSCLDKALQLLALRSHFEAELVRKLRQRSYEAEEIESALGVLRRDGLVDDRRVAMEFAELRRRRRGEGFQRVRQELLRRGVAEDLANEAAGGSSAEEELERARVLAESRARRGADAAAIGRFLSRKGYAKRVILEVLEELRRGLFEEE